MVTSFLVYYFLCLLEDPKMTIVVLKFNEALVSFDGTFCPEESRTSESTLSRVVGIRSTNSTSLSIRGMVNKCTYTSFSWLPGPHIVLVGDKASYHSHLLGHILSLRTWYFLQSIISSLVPQLLSLFHKTGNFCMLQYVISWSCVHFHISFVVSWFLVQCNIVQDLISVDQTHNKPLDNGAGSGCR